MLRSCFKQAVEYGWSIVVRGGGQSFGGQSTCLGGAVVDMTRMTEHGSGRQIGSDWCKCGAGETVGSIQAFLRQRGVRLPIYTSGTDATIGGVLALGGVSGRSFRRGLLAHHVLELEVMGTDGRLWVCRPDHNRNLMDLFLGTAGLAGALVSVCLRTEPLKPWRSRLKVSDIPLEELEEVYRCCVRELELVSLEGFVVRKGETARLEVHAAIECADRLEAERHHSRWESLQLKWPGCSGAMVTTGSIDDPLKFSASLGGWCRDEKYTRLEGLPDGQAALPISLAFHPSDAVVFVKRWARLAAANPDVFATRPYFAMVAARLPGVGNWLRLSESVEHMVAFDIFASFPFQDRIHAQSLLGELAGSAADCRGRLYPYGWMPGTDVLRRLFPKPDGAMHEARRTLDPAGLQRSVLESLFDCPQE